MTTTVTQAVPAHAEDHGDVKEQEPEEEQQDWEHNYSDSGDALPSRQPDVLLLTSPVEGPTADAIPEY